MRITAIHKKRDGSYAIYCDAEPFCVLCEKVFLGSELELHTEVSEERLSKLLLMSDAERAKSAALGFVARRELTRKMLISKLREKSFSDEACSLAADEMEKLDFVNDMRFAEMYAGDSFRSKKHGKRRIVYELTQRGVDRETAQNAADEVEPDPREAIALLLETRLYRDTKSEQGLLRCRKTLERMGYESSDISAVLRELRSESDDTF